MITLEKKVPIPPRFKNHRNSDEEIEIRKAVAHWEVGDSFEIATAPRVGKQPYLIDFIRSLARIKNQNIATRRIDNNTYRVWRVK